MPVTCESIHKQLSVRHRPTLSEAGNKPIDKHQTELRSLLVYGEFEESGTSAESAMTESLILQHKKSATLIHDDTTMIASSDLAFADELSELLRQCTQRLIKQAEPEAFDFDKALTALFGESVKGLSATIERLKKAW